MATVEEYVKRIEAIGQLGRSGNLVAVLVSRSPLTYDFYLKRPFFPLGLSNHYRTAVRIIFNEKSEQDPIRKRTISPPFIFIAVAILLFFIVFDWMIIKTSLNTGRLVSGAIFIAGTTAYHLMTADKIQKAINEEIFLFDQ